VCRPKSQAHTYTCTYRPYPYQINSGRLRSITGENLGLLGTLKKYLCRERGVQKFFFNSLKCLLIRLTLIQLIMRKSCYNSRLTN